VQARVDALIAEYISEYNDKPSKEWLEKAYHNRKDTPHNTPAAAQGDTLPEQMPIAAHASPDKKHLQESELRPVIIYKPNNDRSNTPVAMILSEERKNSDTGLDQDLLLESVYRRKERNRL